MFEQDFGFKITNETWISFLYTTTNPVLKLEYTFELELRFIFVMNLNLV